jgi:hypothetical protein
MFAQKRMFLKPCGAMPCKVTGKKPMVTFIPSMKVSVRDFLSLDLDFDSPFT